MTTVRVIQTEERHSHFLGREGLADLSRTCDRIYVHFPNGTIFDFPQDWLEIDIPLAA